MAPQTVVGSHRYHLLETFLKYLSWPSAFAVFGIAAIAILRSSLADAIGRWRGFKGMGIDADLSGSPASSQIEAQKKLEADNADKSLLQPAQLPVTSPGQLSLPPSSPIYDPIDRATMERLSTALPGSKDSQIAWAARFASTEFVERRHEANYRVFFGSQIAAVDALNQFIVLDPQSVRETFYDPAVGLDNSHISKYQSFEDWSRFLIGTGYVELTSDTPSQMKITQLGRDFLTWMAGRGVAKQKLY
jgi:hypothetical protein